jgi:hypothetical protein
VVGLCWLVLSLPLTWYRAESNVWMMIHAYDRLSFTNNHTWWKQQGWPLLKGVALFHLQKLIPDEHFKDGTLITAPCNSPEQRPITFGCTHQQTIIWQLFNAVEKGYTLAGDDDEAFLQGMLSVRCEAQYRLSRLLSEVRNKRAAMDKGIHIGSWGQLQGQHHAFTPLSRPDLIVVQNGRSTSTGRTTRTVISRILSAYTRAMRSHPSTPSCKHLQSLTTRVPMCLLRHLSALCIAGTALPQMPTRAGRKYGARLSMRSTRTRTHSIMSSRCAFHERTVRRC